MTVIFVVLLGVGSVLMASAIEGGSVFDTLGAILSGQPLTVGSTPKHETDPGTTGSSNPGNGLGTGISHWYDKAITLGYGQNATGVVNTGIDLATPFGMDITSLTSGTVVSTTFSPEIGGQVLVRFQSGLRTLYAAYVHLDSIRVQVNQQIGVGTLIGESGGQLQGGSHPAKFPYSTGPHTLFGIFTKPAASFANSIDPSFLLNQFRKSGNVQ